MADPMRIRAQAAGANATVRVLIRHEMETGLRKDSAGKTIPAWHITDVTATLNGKTVLSAEWGPAVSKNPFLQFGQRGRRRNKIAVTGRTTGYANRRGGRSQPIPFVPTLRIAVAEHGLARHCGRRGVSVADMARPPPAGCKSTRPGRESSLQ
jgi:sulfur-oxidizing protein SoxZ